MNYTKYGAKFRALSDEKRSKLLEVGLKAFSILGDKWRLSVEEKRTVLALEVNEFESIVLNGERGLIRGPLEIKLLTRLSLILGVQKGLELNYPKKHRYDFLHAENSAFDGKSLIKVILADEQGLHTAMKYLQGMRQPGFL